MKETYTTWLLGGSALLLSVACIALSVVFAYTLTGIRVLAATRVLVFIAVGFNLVAAGAFVFFVTIFVQKLNNRTISFDHKSAWRRFGVCAGVTTVAAVLTAATLIWLVVRENELRLHVFRRSSKTLLTIWFVLWGIATALQIAAFTFVARWTKTVLRAQSVGQLDLDLGIRLPQMDELRPATRDTNRSFQSQDPTLAISPPRTPTSRRRSSSLRHSSSTRVGPGSLHKKLVKGSARSSLDFPAGEATSIDTAFDSWDTSSVHREIRLALHSSPPVIRGTLETIPGSRSVSPADALDGPFLPDSPHAASSDAASPLGWNPSSLPRQISSSPPSSPPNFSRPTSRSYNKSNLTGPSMTELIHPLFRPGSPRPPPIAVAGTMVTASPMAGQPITPRTLARMRSNTLPQYWKPMPSPSRSSNAGSIPSSPGLGSMGAGSPGPSIVEVEDLPPILPGFILSAGQRSSLVGYGRRKSTRQRAKSVDSTRLSASLA